MACFRDPLLSIIVTCFRDPLSSIIVTCFRDPLLSLLVACFNDPLLSLPKQRMGQSIYIVVFILFYCVTTNIYLLKSEITCEFDIQ